MRMLNDARRCDHSKLCTGNRSKINRTTTQKSIQPNIGKKINDLSAITNNDNALFFNTKYIKTTTATKSL